MTAAFNLSQLANNLNTSGQLDATDGLTGAVPVANGGTGSTTLTANAVLVGNGTSAVQTVAPGTSGNVLTSNGTTWTSATPASGGGGQGQVFTANGTFTVPSGVTKLKVTVVGGGGGGGGGRGINGAQVGGGGGGGGGAAIAYISSPLSSYSVTVGGGGSAGGASDSFAGTGGTSSFGSVCSATGGTGGRGCSQRSGDGFSVLPCGKGGVGSGGSLNVQGSPGVTGADSSEGIIGGAGGSSIFGGGGFARTYLDSDGANNGNNYGGGGAGCKATGGSINGGSGSAGVVIVEW